MITMTLSVSGSDIASNMADDMEECAIFFCEFVNRINNGDWNDLEDYLKDCVPECDKPKLIKLANILNNVSK